MVKKIREKRTIKKYTDNTSKATRAYTALVCEGHEGTKGLRFSMLSKMPNFLILKIIIIHLLNPCRHWRKSTEIYLV